MNTLSLKPGILSIAFAAGLWSCDSKKPIPLAENPVEITDFTKKHFPNHKILQTMVEKDGFTKTYQVTLNDNTQLEFSWQKEIISIDGNTALPAGVVPSKITEYVAQNFADRTITDWELDNKGQKVKLDNGLELKFSKNGDFNRLDD